MLYVGREPPPRVPGEYLLSTVFCAFVAWLVMSYGFNDWLKYVLYLLVIPPLAAPPIALLIQYAAIVARRFAARVVVRRARSEFRAALRAARVHPELADTARLRKAAAALARLGPADAARAAPEVAAAARHAYAPIRKAGLTVIEAARAVEREART